MKFFLELMSKDFPKINESTLLPLMYACFQLNMALITGWFTINWQIYEGVYPPLNYINIYQIIKILFSIFTEKTRKSLTQRKRKRSSKHLSSKTKKKMTSWQNMISIIMMMMVSFYLIQAMIWCSSFSASPGCRVWQVHTRDIFSKMSLHTWKRVWQFGLRAWPIV